MVYYCFRVRAIKYVSVSPCHQTLAEHTGQIDKSYNGQIATYSYMYLITLIHADHFGKLQQFNLISPTTRSLASIFMWRLTNLVKSRKRWSYDQQDGTIKVESIIQTVLRGMSKPKVIEV